MRLTNIRLAGFKSFVDPTTFRVPGQLVGVVGPNGCGKSNLIDAVRWVMGESSARQLRGELMADVIFNGSSSRKPVGQASIELVFDNRDGRLGGQYARYAEISLKRVIHRDGQSQYFFNGGRCRRRDITDVFLGTGLGPRSYSIIEQGTISRVVEAGPEQLRAFLEEAAGISKYKERRRETEGRVRNARENLSRILDLRDEIGKQLEKLKRQARSAERYQELRKEEGRLRGGLLATRWRKEDIRLAGLKRQCHEAEVNFEKNNFQVNALETQTDKQREVLHDANEELNSVQGRFYRVGSEVSRLEQVIQHERELQQSRLEDLKRLEQGLESIEQHIDSDQARKRQLVEFLNEHEPKLRDAQAQSNTADNERSKCEHDLGEWRARWDALKSALATPRQQAEVERTRIEYHERQVAQLAQRLRKLREEERALSMEEVTETIEASAEDERTFAASFKAQTEALETLQERESELRSMITQRAQMLEQSRASLQQQVGRLASLETLQEAALGKRADAVTDWLAEVGLGTAKRLAECVQVEEGLESALEAALGASLNAVCVDRLNEVAPLTAALGEEGITLFDTQAQRSAQSDDCLPGCFPLIEKVVAPWCLTSILCRVQVAQGLEQALALRHRLDSDVVLVTHEGVLVRASTVQSGLAQGSHSGVLARGREIRELSRAIETTRQSVSDAERALAALSADRAALENERGERQAVANDAHREQSRLQARLDTLRAEREQMSKRQEALRLEREESETQEVVEREDLAAARLTLEEALDELERGAAEQEALQTRHEVLERRSRESRERARAVQSRMHELALQIESRRSGLESLSVGLTRSREQRDRDLRRKEELQSQMQMALEPLELAELQLGTILEDQAAIEEELTTTRQQVETIETMLRELDRARMEEERGVQKSREALETLRLAHSEARVRRDTLSEQIAETGLDLEALLQELPDEITEETWLSDLETTERRIQRLGPVNLAAIEESALQAERKAYLDAQHADLSEALETLEEAMHKIDRETRSRFRAIFEEVSAGLSQLYPRLFGGGEAYLQLTGEDLLDAGVTIMARPPGKRISHIQLLSGGEKALTAVALVFTIFRLNPAPFCMLDEVDAPLDDANVVRFSQLVREMSEQVQFIVITHNKTTMEVLDHLLGVTMHEPGCSRLVTVDVEEAARLAAV